MIDIVQKNGNKIVYSDVELSQLLNELNLARENGGYYIRVQHLSFTGRVSVFSKERKLIATIVGNSAMVIEYILNKFESDLRDGNGLIVYEITSFIYNYIEFVNE